MWCFLELYLDQPEIAWHCHLLRRGDCQSLWVVLSTEGFASGEDTFFLLHLDTASLGGVSGGTKRIKSVELFFQHRAEVNAARFSAFYLFRATMYTLYFREPTGQYVSLKTLPTGSRPRIGRCHIFLRRG